MGWANSSATANGAYGLYLVQSSNLLSIDYIMACAFDASVCVGQSDRVIVCNNLAEFSVVGFQIETSVDANVHNNVACHKSGGIVVFTRPNLPVRVGVLVSLTIRLKKYFGLETSVCA